MPTPELLTELTGAFWLSFDEWTGSSVHAEALRGREDAEPEPS